MIHALLLAMLVTGAAEHRSHPRQQTPAPKAAPKPPPPPAEEVADPDEPPEPDEEEPAPPKGTSDADDFSSQRDRGPYTEEQLQAIGGAVLCTCFCFVVALVALVVFLLRRSRKTAATAATAAPAPAAAAPPPIPFHLSVFAVGLHATARQLVAQQLLLSGAQADPVTAADRTKLVRELAQAVRGLESEWTHFGYGERLDLADEAAAQRSYQLAVEDFAKRSADASLSGEAGYVVMTLVMCTRRQLRGVSALDDRAQIRALLEDRAAVLEHELMGAYIAWSAPLGGNEVLSRFPEMHAVR